MKTDQNKVVLVRVMWLSSPYPMRCLVTLSHNDDNNPAKMYWSTPEFSVSYKNPEKYNATVQKPIERVREKPGNHVVGERRKKASGGGTRRGTKPSTRKPTLPTTTTSTTTATTTPTTTTATDPKRTKPKAVQTTERRPKRKASLKAEEFLKLADADEDTEYSEEEEESTGDGDDMDGAGMFLYYFINLLLIFYCYFFIFIVLKKYL